MTTYRGEGALRRHRVSIPQASYFLTLCTANHDSGLLRREVAEVVRNEFSDIERSGYWRIRALVLMPNHVHALIELGALLPLPRIVGRLKAQTGAALGTAGIRWQQNFFEHRLRPDEAAEPVIRYIHLNPYRKGLIVAGEIWPFFWLGGPESAWYTPTTDQGRPYPEWLRRW